MLSPLFAALWWGGLSRWMKTEGVFSLPERPI